MLFIGSQIKQSKTNKCDHTVLLADQAINYEFIIFVWMWIINELQTWKQYKKKDYLHFSFSSRRRKKMVQISFFQISPFCHFLLFNINLLLCFRFVLFLFRKLCVFVYVKLIGQSEEKFQKQLLICELNSILNDATTKNGFICNVFCIVLVFNC